MVYRDLQPTEGMGLFTVINVVAFAGVGTAYMLGGIYFYGLANGWIRDTRFWCNLSLIGLASTGVQAAKELDPDAITVIPVHLMPGGHVTEADEHAVFNWPVYWIEMPVVSGAPEALEELRSRDTGVWIFTSRHWPRPTTFPVGREDVYHAAWQDLPDIVQITEEWLRHHGFTYDNLTVEAGADHQESRFFVAEERRVYTSSRIPSQTR